MARTTIDFGIELGTSYSRIAVVEGDRVRVFRNIEGHEHTPSAVWENQARELVVGRAAKERLESDPANACAEFKLQMGSTWKKKFERSGREMSPEELSAEVLKYLREDVRRALGEDVCAAVITVPADFDLPENGATRRAGKLAGLAETPLVMEPVAAALAYSHRQPPQTNEHWLVFDFSGGSFAVALIRFRDGMFQVINHAGDKALGGKLIDWAIVETLLVPAVLEKNDLPQFNRGNLKWAAAFGKLKAAAKRAKEALSSPGRTFDQIRIDFLCTDVAGQPVRLDYRLELAELERILEPFVDRAMRKCRECLSEKGIETRHVAKLILVGGPTMSPYLRRRLSDPKTGLGIALEFSVDPMTAVVQGAALFARSQRRNVAIEVPSNAGEYALQLDYKPSGSDPEPMIGGRVSAAGVTDFSGYAIAFINETSGSNWRGSRITLAPDGGFTAVLTAAEFKHNTFAVELFDGQGTRLECTPSSLRYLHGPEANRPALRHAVGIALPDNGVNVFFEQGTQLTASKTISHCTTCELRPGEPGSAIEFVVVEGGNISRADRSRVVGRIRITGNDVRRNLPAGSDIEITITIDESRHVSVRAYVPVLDEEFAVELRLEHKLASIGSLRAAFKVQCARFEALRERSHATTDSRVHAALTALESNRRLQAVEVALADADSDPDIAQKCEALLLKLCTGLDQVEDAVEWLQLTKEAIEFRERARRTAHEVAGSETAGQHSLLEVIEPELQAALVAASPDGLRQRLRELRSRYGHVLAAAPADWESRANFIGRFRFLASHAWPASLSCDARIRALIAEGQRAIDDDCFSALKGSVIQLTEILPPGDRQRVLDEVAAIDRGGGTPR